MEAPTISWVTKALLMHSALLPRREHFTFNSSYGERRVCACIWNMCHFKNWVLAQQEDKPVQLASDRYTAALQPRTAPS